MAINVEYNNREITQMVIENTFKMLENRNIIKSWETEYNKITKEDFQNKNIFELPENKISIYLLNMKLSSISQGHPLDVFLSNNINIHKIIIVKDVAKKVFKQVIAEYKNAEIFFEYEMMIDRANIVFVPKHEIINSEERKELLNKFNEIDLKHILLYDVMSRYYGAKVGDIFKITISSSTSGYVSDYRRVVHGSLDIIFEK